VRYIACMLLAAAGCLVCPGCGQTSLRDYAPLGTSARETLPCLSLDLVHHFVLSPEDRDAMKSLQDRVAAYSYVVVKHRSETTGFRSLCALLNRYFGQWRRLVIIERVDIVSDETGFIVAAVTRNGLVGVTNLRPVGPGFTSWEEVPCPRPFRLDRVKFESCLAELDKAEKDLVRDLFWFPNVDWPLYLLHDVKSDGPYLSVAVCGWANVDDADRAELLKAAPDYAGAVALARKTKPWQAVAPDSKPGKRLRQAGATYASLIARVWESTLGSPDYAIAGTQQK